MEWISCKDRLPEEGEQYIIRLEFKTDTPESITAVFSDGSWFNLEDKKHEFTNVTHWAKLLSPILKPKIVCYCGSLRVALDAFKKAEYESVLSGEIALLPCCMFVDIQREYGADSDYKRKADDLHKRKIDICDEVYVLNVGGYIGESTRSEINYAISIGKPVKYLEPLSESNTQNKG